MKTAIKNITALFGLFSVLAGYLISEGSHRTTAAVFLIIGLVCWGIAFFLSLRIRQLKTQSSLAIKLTTKVEKRNRESSLVQQSSSDKPLATVKPITEQPIGPKTKPPPFKPFVDPKTGAVHNFPMFPNRNPCFEYFRGVFCDVLWTWNYKAEFGETPLGLIPLCPECDHDIPMLGRTVRSHPASYKIQLRCPFHSRIYEIPAKRNSADDFSYIKDMIIETIKDRSWEDRVDGDRARRGY